MGWWHQYEWYVVFPIATGIALYFSTRTWEKMFRYLKSKVEKTVVSERLKHI